MMAICVLGATGVLGTMLVDYLSKNHQVTATIHKDLRFFNKRIPSVEYRQFEAKYCSLQSVINVTRGCDVVINAIGAIPQRTNDETDMYELNSALPKKLKYIDARVIQIATDGVFSGDTGNYNEFSQYDCTDMYGRSKVKGELMGLSHFIKLLRCSIVGRGLYDNYSLLGWFLSQPQNAQINGYADHYWNGITTLAFAKICDGMIRNKYFKGPVLQHIIPADRLSKYELLKLFKKYFNRPDIEIKETNIGKVDRTLTTVNVVQNELYWSLGGYTKPPTIEYLVKELAEYME